MIESIGSRSGFVALRQRGRRVRSGPIWLRYVPGNEGEPARVGFAIGRSLGKAVVRNRIRRRLRAILGELDRSGQLPPGVYLFGVAPEAEQASFNDLRDQMQRAIQQATEATR